jgi:hypothetical protein
MAIMFPRDIRSFPKATEGEIKVFHFLREAAKPNEAYKCWYEPIIGPEGTEPDFIIYGKNLGLIVIEVKDWRLDQIGIADNLNWTIYKGARSEELTNPDKQAKGYVNNLLNLLKNTEGFLSNHPLHRGKLRIPIGRMVAFPNISYIDYYKRGLHRLIPEERALFQEDLDPLGEILCDTSGRKLAEQLEKSLPFQFEGFSQEKEKKLSDLIWPEISIPRRQGVGKDEFTEEVKLLDNSQWKIAFRLGKGHQIIKGPPGSGKTLILVFRCGQLYSLQKRRVLLTCYNIALTSYLKRLIQEKGWRVGEQGIHVCHFFEVCSQVLGEEVKYDDKDPNYYKFIVDLTLDAIMQNSNKFGKFDAVLVDEGQDFDNDMLKVLMALLQPEKDLIIALDNYQDLYRRKASWSSLGINARGRCHYIDKVYRNTIEICKFTQRFIGETPRQSKLLPLFPEEPGIHGELPQLKGFKTINEIEDFLIEDIIEQIRQEQFRRSEIAIIYDDKNYGLDNFYYDNRGLPERLYKLLENSGIPTKWISKNITTKELFDITTDRVSLVSIHSSKGLDFELVYLVGIDNMQPTEKNQDYLARLLYVAMTRAKFKLVIAYIEETEFIKKMKGCLNQGKTTPC